MGAGTQQGRVVATGFGMFCLALPGLTVAGGAAGGGGQGVCEGRGRSRLKGRRIKSVCVCGKSVCAALVLLEGLREAVHRLRR
eukprot:5053490-Pleurochrysis_carterae.AAC.1